MQKRTFSEILPPSTLPTIPSVLSTQFLPIPCRYLIIIWFFFPMFLFAQVISCMCPFSWSVSPLFLKDGITCQYRRHRRHWFDPWVRKIPWRRKLQPTPVFFPGQSHGQRSLVGYSPWGCKLLSTHARTYYRYSFLHVFFTLTSIPEKSLHMGSCTSSSFFFTSSWYSSAWVYRRLRHAFTWAFRSISVLCSCKQYMYTLCTCIVGGIS